MSIILYWFKGYKINKYAESNKDYFDLELIDRRSTSYSAGNVLKIDVLFEKYCGQTIPFVDPEYINDETDDLRLIDPMIMSEMCTKVLGTKEIDEIDMRDRVSFFKELSDEGYYLAYEL